MIYFVNQDRASKNDISFVLGGRTVLFNGLVPICVSRLMERPYANGSPALAGYEPTARYAVKHHALKCCASDRGLTNSSYFAGLSLPTRTIIHHIPVSI